MVPGSHRGHTSDCVGFDLVVYDAPPEASVLMAVGGWRMAGEFEKPQKRATWCVAVDGKLYRLRNPVQRCFDKLKSATRVDKTAESLPGSIDITSVRPWLHCVATWPETAEKSP